MHSRVEQQLYVTRRHFFGKGGSAIGAAALASLLGPEAVRAEQARQPRESGRPKLPHFAPRAKRVIYLCQSGAPSQMDLFDYKPGLSQRFNEDLPDSVRMGQRLTTMTTGSQERLPIAPSVFQFSQHGQSGAWVSELLPYTSQIVDSLCFIRSMHTEAINHDPAITFLQTGSQIAGRPSMGAWISYGLGSGSHELPTFVVMPSATRRTGQPLYDRLWGSGFLPTEHQGVKFRGIGDPVLHLSNPDGINRATRRRILDDLVRLNRMKLNEFGDPEIATRISQYELAYRMQASVPALTDFSDEPEHVLEMYGPESRKRGTYAANCLLARRLAERGVRFIQLFHRGWDQHNDLPRDIRIQCQVTDRPTAALIRDLKQQGLLDETLVIWGGEFGRTIYCQGELTKDNYGRDHHPRCFTIWMAGGGVRPGITYGKTDDHSYNITESPVHVHDLNATILHQLGIDHERLTYRFQGRDFRLTDVHGNVVKQILA